MNITKVEVIAVLRARGANAKADWVDRQLPALVDTDVNSALLEMLELDVAVLTPAKP